VTTQTPPVPAAITPAEYVERQERTRALVRERGLDGILVADPANMHYLTGYNAWSFYTPQLLFVPADDAPVLLMREMDAQGAHRTAVGMPADRIVGYPEGHIHRPDVHPGDWMAGHLRDEGYAAPGRFGFEGEAHFLTPRTFLSISRGLPEWELVDCQDLVNWLRLVKSPAEIDLMRAAGRVCSAALHAGLGAARPGRRQHEVAAEILAAQTRGVGPDHGDYPAIVPIIATGAAADTPHLTWTDEPLPIDEPLSFEITGVHRRYHAPIARTAVLGRPSTALDHLAKVTVEGIEAALGTVRAGVTAGDVARAFSEVIEAAGYEKRSRLGYSIGIGYPPDWGERTVSIRADDHTVLAENMTFHLIAGMWITGSGFEVSESIRVTEGGVETLTDVPRRLLVLGEDA